MSGLSRRSFRHPGAAPATLPPLSRSALAQDAYPSHPIRLVVGFETMKKQGFDPIGGTPDAFGRYLRGEISRRADVARSAG
jgi:tripartite-type tricarboxylate transporter receptor subunit TctC